MAKPALIAVSVILGILGIGGGLFYYSYTQLDAELTDVSYNSITWKPFSWSTLVNVGLDSLTENWLDAALGLVETINLNLKFGVTNNGILPVYVPNITYDVSSNGVHIGSGQTQVHATIYPGDSREIPVYQKIETDSIGNAIKSIVNNHGDIHLYVKGNAYFQLFGLSIPVPFESFRTISIDEQIRSHLNTQILNNQQQQRNSISQVSSSLGESLNKVTSSLTQTLTNAAKSLTEQFFGSSSSKKLDLDLPGIIQSDNIVELAIGRYAIQSFSLNCVGKVQGGYISSGTSGSDNIFLYILNHDEYAAYRDKYSNSNYLGNEGTVTTRYNNNFESSGIIDVTLNSGDYFFVFDTHYSSGSAKTIQIQASTVCI